jgi:hypothetical protein
MAGALVDAGSYNHIEKSFFWDDFLHVSNLKNMI